jgi:hypothetical protein
MIAFLSWFFRRLWCSIRGHRMTPDRIYYPPAKSVTPGYRCTRCSKTQALLYRWQEVRNDRSQDTDTEQ